MKRTVILTSWLLLLASAYGQSVRSELREGNRQYDKQRYDQAETSYRHAMQADSMDYRGRYNLGSALYRQGRYSEAATQYEIASELAGADKARVASALHNQGNALLKAAQQDEQHQGLREAVDAYKKSLLLDPKNDDTRYNLAYAQRLLQQQQQQQQGGGNQQQNSDSQQQQGDQNQQQQQGDQQQDQQNGQQDRPSQPQQGDQHPDDGQDQQQPQQQPRQPDQRQVQDAERVLDAVKNNERQTLRDKQRAAQKVRTHKSDKDW